MKGFKDFLLRGNLIDLAVAFIMAAAFGAVVTAFTQLVMDIIGKLGGAPDFSAVAVGGVNIGKFITALVAFVIMSAVVYFGIVKPYDALKKMTEKPAPADEAGAPTSEELLAEIRDLLANQQQK
ncbi:MAG: large conductance mechanosensitive channel protein MscL [Actinobacteria bacterium]|nr:large conductance mechanosensitive channel protein MscL [Actinomycetota bacterium]